MLTKYGHARLWILFVNIFVNVGLTYVNIGVNVLFMPVYQPFPTEACPVTPTAEFC